MRRRPLVSLACLLALLFGLAAQPYIRGAALVFRLAICRDLFAVLPTWTQYASPSGWFTHVRRKCRYARACTPGHRVRPVPDIPELSRFEITPTLTDRIEAVALWVATESGVAPTGRIGLIGVSFSGGLAIVAAGRSSLRGHHL
jgi:hypothetical protein